MVEFQKLNQVYGKIILKKNLKKKILEFFQNNFGKYMKDNFVFLMIIYLIRNKDKN